MIGAVKIHTLNLHSSGLEAPASEDRPVEFTVPGMTVSPARKDGGFDALVTQGWGRIAYNIVRSLGRKGLRVAVGTDEFLGMAALSRYTASMFRHPSFVRRAPEFIASLRETLRRLSPRVYLPSDQEILLIAKYRDQFSQVETKIPIAPFDTLKLLHRKDSSCQLAASLGIPTPATICPKNEADIIAFAREYGDPVVVKRLSSSASRGVSYLNLRELLSGNGDLPVHRMPFGEFLVQSYVKGTGYGVSMLFNHGELRAKFTHRRLREKLSTGGISTLRMSAANPLLEEYAETLLRSVRFHGVAMVEFKYNEDRKEGWLLEVNPRFWGSLALAIQSGVDFPYLLYKMAVEGDIQPCLDYKKNVTVRWIFGDVLARLRQLKSSGRVKMTPEGGGSVQGYDDFYWDDPLPFIGQLFLSIVKQVRTKSYGPHETDLSVDQL